MQVFPAILDEFGSTLDNSKEMMCMQSIEAYANAKSPSNSTSHAPLTSWFFWSAPDPEPFDMLDQDQGTIHSCSEYVKLDRLHPGKSPGCLLGLRHARHTLLECAAPDANDLCLHCRAWQPDSYGTGGIVDTDWRTIMW